MIDLLLGRSALPAVTLAAEDPGSLDRLADIVAPPPVPGWPPAPGWYVVAGLAAAALVALAIQEFLRWRRNAYRRAALRELEELIASARKDPAQWGELPALLKRVALAAYPRQAVAGLSGEPWLSFLDQTGGSPRFASGPGRLLQSLAYDPQACRRSSPESLTAAADAVRAWIHDHRVPASSPQVAGGTSC